MAVHFHQHDLPDSLAFGASVAVDTETMGLQTLRDRLCLVQLSGGDGDAHIVQIAPEQDAAPRLAALIADPNVLKIMHFARFDIAALEHRLGVPCAPVWCTKIASKLTRTYTDRHGLKDLCKDLLGVDISKQQQSSDWGADSLTDAQLEYAASDVLHLHKLKDALTDLLRREKRISLAEACFEFLPHRARLDLAGWPDVDIFAHS